MRLKQLGLSTLGIVLLILVILLLLGALPVWGFHGYGYGPSGAVTFLLVIVVVLLVAGRL